ncbi:MAG: Na+/H+ antiporter NhaA [Anaerolineae bacterium]|nr:Na+/H+ antiporter NhaA [Anaerolineae bacterium]
MVNVDELKQELVKSPTNGIKTIFREFINLEATGGILLILMTVIALVWANSPWSESYLNIWQTKMTVGFGDWALSKSLILWINDGLMAVFFFVVGLEIKREVLAGELASPRKAALPLAAAIGGMAVPALLYYLFNTGTPAAAGWGIPMATDIAFTLGVLALLGTRAPLALKIFVTALAIVDDIGAVMVIALFYTAEIAWTSLAVGGGILLLLIALNRAKVIKPLPYAALGVGLWIAFLYSGVHATVAGVLLAMTIPARVKVNTETFLAQSRAAIQDYENACCDEGAISERGKQAAARILELASESVESPLQRLEHRLHPWVVYVIMPIFALANAGVVLVGEDFLAAFSHPLSLGVVVGLVVGKSVGISLLSWLAVRIGLAELPQGVTIRHIIGAGFLAGIGFTMSLFIANLAFPSGELLTVAKVGILSASLIAGVTGWGIIRSLPNPATS